MLVLPLVGTEQWRGWCVVENLRMELERVGLVLSDRVRGVIQGQVTSEGHVRYAAIDEIQRGESLHCGRS